MIEAHAHILPYVPWGRNHPQVFVGATRANALLRDLSLGEGMKVVLAVFLGFSAFFVRIASDIWFGPARGPTPMVAYVIMGAYLAICEFFVAQKGMEPGENWPTLLGMAAPPIVIETVVLQLFQGSAHFIHNGIPTIVASSLGPVVGAIAAWALPKQTTQA